MKISFYGAAQEITGSCFLLESEGNKILIDCGLFQCPRFCDIRSRELFTFDTKNIGALFVTHAHIDHTGRIPKLVKEGFHGKIYSTYPTRDLAELMLKDSVGVLSKEAVKHSEPVIYEEEDVDRVMELWEGKNYHESVTINNFKITIFNAGHILGSAMYLVEAEGKKVLFTGDLGNPSNPLLPLTEKVNEAEVLVMEATYGDRTHEEAEEKKLKLERAIEKSVVLGGVLMIPAFSLERTQEIIWEIADMLKNKQIPNIPIFIDSPLAIHATEIYQKYFSYLSPASHIKKDSFSFLRAPNVHMTLTTEESKKINEIPAPKIVIAGSGMSTGGRILHHERRYLKDPKSTILFVGFQAPGSLGRQIQDGASSVTLFGEEVPVLCHKEEIRGYSAHPDEDALFEFVREKTATLKEIFIIHAEPKTGLSFVQKLRDYAGVASRAPKYGESVEI